MYNFGGCMKHFIRIAAAAFVAILLSSCMINRQKNGARTITVNGTGTVYASPDTATIELAVVTQSWVAKNAVTTNATIMTNVINALKANEVKNEDIFTSDFNISQRNDWQDGKPVPGKYTVSNNLSVIIRKTDSVGQIIDAATGAGANQLTALSFSVSDKSDLIRQARTLAVKQAQDAGSFFAGTNGCRLGQVLTISENDNSGVYTNNRLSETKTMSSANLSTPVSAGKIPVTSNITITYALQ